jgi:hypothetical protein
LGFGTDRAIHTPRNRRTKIIGAGFRAGTGTGVGVGDGVGVGIKFLMKANSTSAVELNRLAFPPTA